MQKNNSDILGRCWWALPLTAEGSGAYFAGRIVMTAIYLFAFSKKSISLFTIKVNRFSVICKIDLEIQKGGEKMAEILLGMLVYGTFAFMLCFSLYCGVCSVRDKLAKRRERKRNKN